MRFKVGVCYGKNDNYKNYVSSGNDVFAKTCNDEYTKLKLEEYSSKIPIELDTSGFFNFTIHNTVKKELFLDSCIHIITETSFSGNELFVSEKVLKPIVNYQPFIALGPVNYLKELKRLGFKTFSDFWDESYDEIHNNSDRMIRVYSLVKYLCEKTNEEWDELNKQLYPILEHNRNHLLSLTELGISETYIENLNKLLEHEPNKENYSLL